jgi:hypothetical protein
MSYRPLLTTKLPQKNLDYISKYKKADLDLLNFEDNNSITTTEAIEINYISDTPSKTTITKHRAFLKNKKLKSLKLSKKAVIVTFIDNSRIYIRLDWDLNNYITLVEPSNTFIDILTSILAIHLIRTRDDDEEDV